MRRAFSLVEILVTIGIIAVLIAILIPALAGTKESASELKSLANLRSIGQLLANHAAENNGAYPFYEPGSELRWGPDGEQGTTINDLPWEAREQWAALDSVRAVAPWRENYESWLSPGVEPHPEGAWVQEDSHGRFTRWPSYQYSNSFIGKPAVWSENRPDFFDSAQKHALADVRFPSQKVVMWDEDREYLLPEPHADDPRPVLFADTSASLRLDADATPPVRNPAVFPARVYNDTPSGIHGRDF